MAETKKVSASKSTAKPANSAKPATEAAPKAVKTAPNVEKPAPKATLAKKVYPQIKVTLIKSAAHSLVNQKKTIEALGLKKIGQSKVHNDIPAIQGMIFKVQHLVKVEKI